MSVEDSSERKVNLKHTQEFIQERHLISAQSALRNLNFLHLEIIINVF